MPSSFIHRMHAHHHAQQASPLAAADTTMTAEDILAGTAAPRRSQSAVVLPVAAPLSPHQRAGAALDSERLREIDPQATPPEVLATVLLPAMDQPRASKVLIVKNLIAQLQGEHLQALKSHLERQAPGALMNFVFQRCPKDARDALLAHFRDEAPAAPRAPYILSDIDNTVCPSRDPRLPKSTTSYPGRAALWSAILGEGDVSDRTCFLSARFGNAVLPWHLVSQRERRVTFANLARVGITRPKVLFGSVRDLPYPTLRGINMSPLGSKKIKNFEMLRQVFPEYRYVFFGDTCEDDLRVGQAMLQTAGQNVGAVFMHDFGSAGRAWTREQRSAAEAQGVIFYKTVPGAALAAFEGGRLGLTHDDLRRVAQHARRELQAIVFESPAQQEAAEKLLLHDLEAIDAALTPAA